MGTELEAWLRANWYVATTIAFGIVFFVFAVLSIRVEITFWPHQDVMPAYSSGVLILVGGTVLVFGIALLVAALLKKIRVVRGIICGSISCLVGGSFWYLFGLYAAYS